jgi:hypothetical protein|tara:strand:- start:284 stop:520 length:237 start_codon:yes stop_codon:yes gene_type:complete
MAPREWRLKVADKLSEYKFDQNYENIINELRRDQHKPEKYQELQTAFIKYNDRQDQFRKVKKTWRELLPDLERLIVKA